MTIRRGALAGGVALLLAAPVAAEVDIRAVTLSTAGTALLEATGRQGEDGLTLSLRRGDLDAFLKSAVIADPVGALPELRLPGPGALQDAFDLLPIDADALADRARLLGAFTGAGVEAERRGVTLRGRLMGVAARDCEAGRCHVLSLRDDAGTLHAFNLSPALAVRLTDAADQAVLDRALEAQRAAANGGLIPVRIDSADPADREVALSWLQDAPQWRTAWRAVERDDGLELTGWAVVENTTGHDWDAVDLTLATGAVQALRVPLYDRLPAPDAAFAPEMLAADAPRRALAAPEHAVADAQADDGASFTRFMLQAPVTLAAGEMISLPFLRETLADARRLVHRGGAGARHPQLALELENPLPLRLPAGVLTLYEDGRGHAGDAMVPELAPGAQAVVDFARDTAITIAEETSRTERVRELRIRDGVMELREDLERRTRYRIDGAADRARTLTLDHPRDSDWDLLTEGGEERLDATRWEVDVPPGALTVFEVHERQPRLRRIALADLDAAALSRWQRDAPDDAARALLAELAALRSRIEALRRDAQRLRALEDDLSAEQERLVGVITALGTDSAADRDRRARVDALDAEITAAATERRTAEAEADRLRAELAARLSAD